MKSISRRHFLTEALITGTAMAAFPMVLVRRSRAEWAISTAVHPHVNNLRVVAITDPRMAKSSRVVSSWARQDELVVVEAVWENIDKLACALAETRHPRDAWNAIFVKPPHKSWSETVVAIKTNHIGIQHTRSAVMAKICRTLIDILGVKPSNIHIYDAIHGRGMSKETPFAGLPQGCRIEDDWGEVKASTSVPGPWKKSSSTSRCLRHLVDGSVDILINIAMCKGHSREFGGFTMTMKNHFGTFSPMPGHMNDSLDYLIAVNQTPEILGPMDKRTGRVLHPRQQLCLVDALWASKGGPYGGPSHQPNFLAMGVLSPVVDFQVATKFRGEKMGWQPDMKVLRRVLEDFGIHERDLPAGGRIVEA